MNGKSWSCLVLLAAVLPLHAEEIRLGAGLFNIADNGRDVQLGYRPADSRWEFGYRYLRWTDTFTDPFTGHQLTETTDSLSGPYVNYLFAPQQRRSWYLGASLLRWSRLEKSLMTGATSSDATTDPYFGGGYTGLAGEHFYYNLGAFIAPSAGMYTDTGVSSEDSQGGFDIQVQFGVRF